jgi:hypothetical protein
LTNALVDDEGLLTTLSKVGVTPERAYSFCSDPGVIHTKQQKDKKKPKRYTHPFGFDF